MRMRRTNPLDICFKCCTCADIGVSVKTLVLSMASKVPWYSRDSDLVLVGVQPYAESGRVRARSSPVLSMVRFSEAPIHLTGIPPSRAAMFAAMDEEEYQPKGLIQLPLFLEQDRSLQWVK